MTEEYRILEEFPNYAADSLGNIINVKTGLVLKAFENSRGYLRVTMPGHQHKFVHILVATAFCPKPEGATEVNHKNGLKLDCRPENLEWVTHSQNILHAYEMGLNPWRGHGRYYDGK